MSQRRSSARRHNRNRAISTGVQDVGIYLSNLASRIASQFTRKNRDHLVVPLNESFRRSKSSSSRSSGSPRKQKTKSVDLNDIDTALGFKQFRLRSVKKHKK